MNTANLQLEGVYMVMAALLRALVDKAVISEAEVDALLRGVEHNVASGVDRPVEIRASNVEAMSFPARFLTLAMQASSRGQHPSFAEITSQIKHLRSE